MTTDAANAGEEMDPASFDVVFAYPWPDEEAVVAALFERHSSPGAILATYHGGDGRHVGEAAVEDPDNVDVDEEVDADEPAG